ncbi:hypothetical protein [Methylobacterium pseudosasicola]|uniref:Uncharacterized protein n=1 Tax=Methylobacterium pseudosasicola TaxID=582667 RepID=A0A1I4UT02_9HYPH|nr:hypothetical protein [Methylobacterium pseudosasicola]SFM92045.1 hypothetical protein SAMN05192568_107614 [Methylobacterium pseudosasicola]
MGDLHRLPLRDLPPAPTGISVPETWAALRVAMRLCHGTLGEVVDLLEAGAAPADVFARIDTFNSQITTCGRAVTFLREVGEPPDAA